jgi:hypothetical protein
MGACLCSVWVLGLRTYKYGSAALAQHSRPSDGHSTLYGSWQYRQTSEPRCTRSCKASTLLQLRCNSCNGRAAVHVCAL